MAIKIPNILKTLRLKLLSKINNVKNKQHVSLIKRFNGNSDKKCPICDSSNTKRMGAIFEEEVVEKTFCGDCYHIFSYLNLTENTQKAKGMFQYTKKSANIHCHELLLKFAMKKTKKGGNILDFGVGGNGEAYLTYNKKYNYNFYGCDIINMDLSNYFITYKDEAKHGLFDCIISHNVVEHMDDTLNSWIYLNRLLKPIEKGNSYLVFAFPSTMVYEVYDWQSIIKPHVCVFSEMSFKRCLAFSGFTLILKKLDARIKNGSLVILKKEINK